MEFKSHAALDFKIRMIKSKKIISILKEYKNLSKSKILDIGTGGV